MLFNACLRPVQVASPIPSLITYLAPPHLSYQEEGRFDTCLTSIEENANYQQSEFHKKPQSVEKQNTFVLEEGKSGITPRFWTFFVYQNSTLDCANVPLENDFE